jgi:hypothetical protein
MDIMSKLDAKYFTVFLTATQNKNNKYCNLYLHLMLCLLVVSYLPRTAACKRLLLNWTIILSKVLTHVFFSSCNINVSSTLVRINKESE